MSKQCYIATGLKRSKNEFILDVFYPQIQVVKPNDELTALSGIFTTTADWQKHEYSHGDLPYFESCEKAVTASENANGYADKQAGVFVLASLDQPIKSAEEAYFKLQCLSQRLIKPHQCNLDGLFGLLTNVAWTNKGPVLPEDVNQQRLVASANSEELSITHVDKFPYLVNYHIPSGVRIASGSQVRLGAYLGKGTTVMPAGYVNFNAGTLGNAMVEGRVSAGVVIGDDSDVGGGASIMGTLSGGNKDVISVGKNCLLGANAGTGISLGDGCTIEAGLYVTAGSKIALLNSKNQPVDLQGNATESPKNIVKAKQVSGKENLLFIKDSQTGKILCKPNKNAITLNAQLHQND